MSDIERLTRAEWDNLSEDEKFQYAYWRDWDAQQLERLLDHIPPCPQHGRCIPYAVRWLKAVQELPDVKQLEVKITVNAPSPEQVAVEVKRLLTRWGFDV